MNILGISCFYHDSAAALVKDGEIRAAVQEERFTRKKHDPEFPLNSIEWCLKEAGITAGELDFIVFYDKPIVKFDRILETFLAYAPSGIRQFIKAMPVWLKQKLWVSEIIRRELNFKGKILFASHHESHAASAFYPSPFKEAAFLTMDGVGEWETASFGLGRDSGIDIFYSMRFPHSLGLLYSAFTYYTGFKVNSGEYKLMGLAPYGEPRYAQVILDRLVDLKQDGSFKLNMEYFGYCNGSRMTNNRFNKIFGEIPRIPETTITSKHMDIAASIQKVAEEIVMRTVRHVHTVTQIDNLCLAGGVALNCTANGKIVRDGPFKNVWIQPASGDAGGALGAALLIWHRYLKNSKKIPADKDFQKNSFLGTYYSDEVIEKFLNDNHVPYSPCACNDIPDAVSDLIINGNVVGWFQGKMEFGPRALGARSIIADSRDPHMQSRLNMKIKFRESFRPFAPVVLKEHASEWFDIDKESPYMLITAPVHADKRTQDFRAGGNSFGFDKLRISRSSIPSVTHVDYSSRIQTIDRNSNQLFYDMINSFYRKTGCPVIINTSFNVRGEPLVCSPEDVFRCFMRTHMDYLMLGSFLLDKRKQVSVSETTVNSGNFERD